MTKKKKIKINDIIKTAYKETKRSSLLVYLILRILVIICMILQIIHGDLNNALLCLLSLVFLMAPMFIQNKFAITLPDGLEISIYLFIFAAEILGEINNFYGIIPFWDSILHTINGFLAAAIGFSLVDLLNRNSSKFNLSPFYLCIVAFCFSMTIGVLWEFYEYGSDRIFHFDMQKDTLVTSISSVAINPDKKNKVLTYNNIDKTVLYNKENEPILTISNGYLDLGLIDTMGDLFVNFIGALVFSVFGYITLKNHSKKSIIDSFVPQKGKRKIPESVSNQIAEFKKEHQKVKVKESKYESTN